MGALDGIRVLELAQMWAVPGAGMYLGDQGAEIIKVEPPWGDEGRRIMSSSPIKTGDRELARHFFPINRNKKSIAIDMTKKEGLEIVHKISKTADILLHNYRPEACRRMGIDFETMHKINPRLIYLGFSPYGEKGPYVNKPGYDRVIQAVSGTYARQAAPGGSPIDAGVWIADCSVPMLIAYGVTLALFMRERTGKGQKVSASLLGSALAMQSVELVRANIEDPNQIQNLADQAMFSPYICRDGKWFILVVVTNKEWVALSRTIGRADLSEKAGYGTALGRSANSDELFRILCEKFATRPRKEWLDLLDDAGVPNAPILKPAEVFENPQILQNEYIIEVDDPRVGPMKMLGIPVRLSDAPGSIRTLAPELGQHTSEVLAELGYGGNEVKTLRSNKVVK
ncbi:MAG: CoA transferase [Deltaproteobacteria bacterium]|nr:CoA transferase [Deltaproteobacteria bacterium]